MYITNKTGMKIFNERMKKIYTIVLRLCGPIYEMRRNKKGKTQLRISGKFQITIQSILIVRAVRVIFFFFFILFRISMFIFIECYLFWVQFHSICIGLYKCIHL